MENGERRSRRCALRSDLVALGPGLAAAALKRLWALPAACFPPISRLRLCCAHGSVGCARPVSDSICVIGGLAGTSRGLSIFPHRRDPALPRPMRWSLPLVEVAGRSSALMLRGCPYWLNTGFTVHHSCGGTVASTWAGASIFG